MSLHRLSAGAGYSYLLRHTACGDVQRAASTPLTAYYTEAGYPPGRSLGSGLTAGTAVTEAQMAALYGEGRDPVTGASLGRGYPVFAPLADRVARKFAALPEALDPQHREVRVAEIEATERNRRTPSAVAGFDLTFTVPKSVSVLWALADPRSQAAVAEAYRAAVDDALAFLEARALFTRTGAAGCAQVPTRGMLAAAFEHWDTRTGDPNLHTHVVIANKVQGPDGGWRSLDSRALHHATVAVSELYDDRFADHRTARLTVRWRWHSRGERRSPAYELDGIDDPLLAAFSSRSAQVDAAGHLRIGTSISSVGHPPRIGSHRRPVECGHVHRRSGQHRKDASSNRRHTTLSRSTSSRCHPPQSPAADGPSTLDSHDRSREPASPGGTHGYPETGIAGRSTAGAGVQRGQAPRDRFAAPGVDRGGMTHLRLTGAAMRTDMRRRLQAAAKPDLVADSAEGGSGQAISGTCRRA